MAVNLFGEDAVISEKVRDTAGVFSAHLANMTESTDNWASFLSCAGRMYKYSFVDQVLIHAQRPDAAACAGMDFWNGRMDRWVRRGSKGIALIDLARPDKPRLKYVFDIRDTQQSGPASDAPYIWRMGPEHTPHVRKMLAAVYGLDDPDMKAQITGIVKRMTANRAETDEGYKDLVADSAVYSIMSRCGLETGCFAEEFSSISRYGTDEKVLELGLAAVELSEKILMNI